MNKAVAATAIALLTVAMGANAHTPRVETFVHTFIQTEGTEVTQKGERCTLTFRWIVPSKLAPNLRDTVVSQLDSNCKVIEKRGFADQVEGRWQPSEKAKALWSNGQEAVERAWTNTTN